ncbi:MAG: AI-2E family transporter [Chloroflexota bacterium]
MIESRRPWLPRTKLTVSLLLLGLFIYLLSRFSEVIPPIILAGILAYAINPVVNKLDQRFSWPRLIFVTVIYIVLVALLIAIPAVFIPPLAKQIAGINLDIQQFLQQGETVLGQQYSIAGFTIDSTEIVQQAIAVIQELLQPLFGHTLGFAVDVITSLVWVIFILVVSFYLVKDSASLETWVAQLPPPAYQDDFRRLRVEITRIWGDFFRGQLILGSGVALSFTLLGLILGMPFALAMGVLAGLLEFLPSIGHGIWLVVAVIVSLVAGSTWMAVPNWVFALIIVVLHLFYQQFDLNYLIPRIIGRKVHLPPLVIILGIVAGAAFAGVLGILLAAPTIASSRVLGRYIFANLTDTDPFPSESTEPLPPPDSRWWAIRRDSDDEPEENPSA